MAPASAMDGGFEPARSSAGRVLGLGHQAIKNRPAHAPVLLVEAEEELPFAEVALATLAPHVDLQVTFGYPGSKRTSYPVAASRRQRSWPA
jgi:hypothetical protein